MYQLRTLVRRFWPVLVIGLGIIFGLPLLGWRSEKIWWEATTQSTRQPTSIQN